MSSSAQVPISTMKKMAVAAYLAIDNPANRGGPTCTEFGNGGAVGRFMCYLDHLQATAVRSSHPTVRVPLRDTPTDHLQARAVLSSHPHCASATAPYCAPATY